MADVAQYLHATLYRFNEQARAEVMTRFREAIGDDEINISYSSITDVFFLQCHSQQGAAADFELNRIINDYINEEIQTAEKEDVSGRLRVRDGSLILHSVYLISFASRKATSMTWP